MRTRNSRRKVPSGTNCPMIFHEPALADLDAAQLSRLRPPDCATPWPPTRSRRMRWLDDERSRPGSTAERASRRKRGRRDGGQNRRAAYAGEVGFADAAAPHRLSTSSARTIEMSRHCARAASSRLRDQSARPTRPRRPRNGGKSFDGGQMPNAWCKRICRSSTCPAVGQQGGRTTTHARSRRLTRRASAR